MFLWEHAVIGYVAYSLLIEWLDRALDSDFTHVRTVDGYTDVQPLMDKEFDVSPYYTCVVDLDWDPEDVLMGFSGDARSNVRDAEGSTWSTR